VTYLIIFPPEKKIGPGIQAEQLETHFYYIASLKAAAAMR